MMLLELVFLNMDILRTETLQRMIVFVICSMITGCMAITHHFISTGEYIIISSNGSHQTAENDPLVTIWTFNTSVDHKIRVEFLLFDIRGGYSFMDIGDGMAIDEDGVRFNNKISYTKLASFSGQTSPSDVTSVCNAAWIRLSLKIRNKPTYIMKVSAVLSSEPITVDQRTPLSIKSPIYPSTYHSNFYSQWDIVVPDGFAISVAVRSIDIENGMDHLYIGDGVDKFANQGGAWKDWTGSRQHGGLQILDFVSNSSSIIVIFTTDFSTIKVGFWIQFHRVENDEISSNGETTRILHTYNFSTTTTTTSNIIDGASELMRDNITKPWPSTNTVLPTKSQERDERQTVPATESCLHRGSTELGVTREVLILAALSSSLVFVLLLISMRWTYGRCRKYHINRAKEKQYYDVVRNLPAPPPPRKAVTSSPTHGAQIPSSANPVIRYYSAVGSQNDTDGVYECVPNFKKSPAAEFQIGKVQEQIGDQSGYLVPNAVRHLYLNPLDINTENI